MVPVKLKTAKTEIPPPPIFTISMKTNTKSTSTPILFTKILTFTITFDIKLSFPRKDHGLYCLLSYKKKYNHHYHYHVYLKYVNALHSHHQPEHLMLHRSPFAHFLKFPLHFLAIPVVHSLSITIRTRP